MTPNDPDDSEDDRSSAGDPIADRQEPTGAPVVRGDPEITGARAKRAIEFDPDDPESLQDAADIVREFAAGTETPHDTDALYMLRGAAACAALVRGTGSYQAAAHRAGDEVSVNFLRKWSRVHDLPISIRRHIALGDIVPSTAQHIARLSGDARFQIAWAVIDNDLSVREVRTIVSTINDGASVEEALRDVGITPGQLRVQLPMHLYRELRRHAALSGSSPDELVAEALAVWLADRE